VLWYRQGYPSHIVADNDVTMAYGGAAVHHGNTMVCYVTTMVTKDVTSVPCCTALNQCNAKVCHGYRGNSIAHHGITMVCTMVHSVSPW
jgi:hypothetical protein